MSPEPHDPVRRRLVAALGMASVPALAALPACTPGAPFRVAVTPGFGALSFLLAREQHLLEGHHTELTPMQAPDAARMLREGRIDAATLGLEQAVQLRAVGLALAVVAICDVSAGGDALMCRPGFVLAAAPAGSSIAVDTGLRSAVLLSLALEHAGLAPGAIRRTAMPADPVSALTQSRIDGVVSRLGTRLRLHHAGMVPAYDTRQAPRLLMDVLAVRADALADHGPAIRRLLRVHFATVSDWRRNPVDASHRLAAPLGIEPVDVVAVAAGFELPDERANLEALSAPASELHQAVRACERLLSRDGRLPGTPGPPLLFVPDHLPA